MLQFSKGGFYTTTHIGLKPKPLDHLIGKRQNNLLHGMDVYFPTNMTNQHKWRIVLNLSVKTPTKPSGHPHQNP